MKHGKRPSVRQKKLMQERNLNPADWLVTKDTTEMMVIVNRWSDKTVKYVMKE